MSEPPIKLSMVGVRAVSPPPAPVSGLSPKEAAGLYLAKKVLLLISGFVVLLFIYLAYGEYCYKSNYRQYREMITVSNVAFSQATNIVPTYSEYSGIVEKDREAHKDYGLKLIQVILINVLLPVLTALLGYIFGKS